MIHRAIPLGKAATKFQFRNHADKFDGAEKDNDTPMPPKWRGAERRM